MCGADLGDDAAVTYRPRMGRVGRLATWVVLALISLCVVVTAVLSLWRIFGADP